jgi:hypothetical protein
VTAAQINQFVDMESHEEKLHQMIQQSKENEAKETGRRKQLELAEARKKQLREDKMNAASGGGMSPSNDGPTSSGGFGPNSFTSAGGAFETSMDGSGGAERFDRQRRQEDLLARQAALVAAAAVSRAPTISVESWNPSMNADAVDHTSVQPATAPKRGLALGGGNRRRLDH